MFRATFGVLIASKNKTPNRAGKNAGGGKKSPNRFRKGKPRGRRVIPPMKREGRRCGKGTKNHNFTEKKPRRMNFSTRGLS